MKAPIGRGAVNHAKEKNLVINPQNNVCREGPHNHDMPAHPYSCASHLNMEKHNSDWDHKGKKEPNLSMVGAMLGLTVEKQV